MEGSENSSWSFWKELEAPGSDAALNCIPEPRSAPSPGDGHTEGFPRVRHPLGDAPLSSPPPQRRHRARSLPVPRGRTATGGCFTRFALSAGQGRREVEADKVHSLLLSVSLLSQQPGMMLLAGSPPHFHWGISGICGRSRFAGTQLSPAHLCSPGSNPPCHPLHRPAHGNLECPERSSAWRKAGETRGEVGQQGPVAGGRGSPAAAPYPGVGPPRSRLYTWRGLSR